MGLLHVICNIIFRRCHDCLTSDLAETSRRVTTCYVGAEELPLPGTPAWPGLGWAQYKFAFFAFA